MNKMFLLVFVLMMASFSFIVASITTSYWAYGYVNNGKINVGINGWVTLEVDSVPSLSISLWTKQCRYGGDAATEQLLCSLSRSNACDTDPGPGTAICSKARGSFSMLVIAAFATAFAFAFALGAGATNFVPPMVVIVLTILSFCCTLSGMAIGMRAFTQMKVDINWSTPTSEVLLPGGKLGPGGILAIVATILEFICIFFAFLGMKAAQAQTPTPDVGKVPNVIPMTNIKPAQPPQSPPVTSMLPTSASPIAPRQPLSPLVTIPAVPAAAAPLQSPFAHQQAPLPQIPAQPQQSQQGFSWEHSAPEKEKQVDTFIQPNQQQQYQPLASSANYVPTISAEPQQYFQQPPPAQYSYHQYAHSTEIVNTQYIGQTHGLI